MCSILGIKGQFKANSLNKMLEITKHRGPDSTGLYLQDKNNEILEKNLKNFTYSEENFNIGLAHNLLSIYKSTNNLKKDLENNRQPFKSNNLILIFNGEIYNCNIIKEKLGLNESLSDGEVLLKLIENTSKGKLSKKVLFDVISNLDGDYAFAVYDGEELILARDPIGVKPLYYSLDNDNLSFASEPKALKNNSKIYSLKPGHILYKNQEYLAYNLYGDNELIDDYAFLKEEIIKKLYSSVYDRVSNLDKVGLLCSGGVDSAFIAYILKDISKKTDLKVKLYAVGNENSKDIYYSKKIAENLNLPLKIQKTDKKLIKNNIHNVITAIEDTNLMKLGVATTIYLATKMMKEDGIKVGITGQGADELFAGYNRYIKHIENNTPENLQKELIHDIKNIHQVNLERDDAASMKNSIELRLPYLSNKMIKLALKTPIKYKITSKEDKLKKHILRDAALTYGIPEEISNRPKKAAQYGSGIDKIIKKKLQKEMDFTQILNDYYHNLK